MNFINKFLVLPMAIILIAASGCASYKTHTLNKLTPEWSGHSQSSNNVTLSVKAFTKYDCKRYLDRDVLCQGYQPVQITIENQSPRYLVFTPDSISLPQAFPEDVAQTVHTSTVGRAVGWGVAGLFIWPFLIPAVVDGVGSHQANKSLDQDFYTKSIREQVIQPYSTINGLIFVPMEYYQESFSITLVDKQTTEKITLCAYAPAD